MLPVCKINQRSWLYCINPRPPPGGGGLNPSFFSRSTPHYIQWWQRLMVHSNSMQYAGKVVLESLQWVLPVRWSSNSNSKLNTSCNTLEERERASHSLSWNACSSTRISANCVKVLCRILSLNWHTVRWVISERWVMLMSHRVYDSSRSSCWRS